MELQFNFEWEEPGGARDAELRATWARLDVRVHNESVTRLIDRVAKSEREGIYAPLLPIAEWFVQNWFFLFNEVGSQFTRDAKYDQRHTLRMASEGFAVPDLRFLPAGEVIDVIWRPSRGNYQQVEFISGGETRLASGQVREAISAFINAVVERLIERDLADAYIVGEWAAVQSLVSEELDFAEAIAAIGIDPFDAPRNVQNAILTASSTLPSEVLPELLSISGKDELLNQTKWMSDAVETLEAAKPGMPTLRDVATDLRTENWRKERPYERGLAVARRVRSEFDLDGNPIRGLDSISRLFGSTRKAEQSGIVFRPDQTQRIQAVALGGEQPRFLLTKKRGDSRRFSLSRALYGYLVGSFEHVDIVADSYFTKDQSSRAFAAEFLAPSEGLRQRIKTPLLFEEDVAELAEEFDVSNRVIENQVVNNELAELAYHSG